jgi:hypothetical protein
MLLSWWSKAANFLTDKPAAHGIVLDQLPFKENRMSKLVLNSTQIASLTAARTAYNPKSARKAAWQAIRAAFNIPAVVRKLGAEIDEMGDPNFGAVYDKDSRKFLTVSPITGRYVAIGDEVKPLTTPTPAAAPVADTPAPAPADVPVDSDPTVTPAVAATLGIPRFTLVSTTPTANVKVIAKDDLLALLRDMTDESKAADLPAGAPALGADDLLVDNVTGDVYFRA